MKTLFSKFKEIFITTDKELHCIVSMILVSLLSIILPLMLAVLITFVIGIMKELYDKYIKRTLFDVYDLYADVIGITIQGMLIYLHTTTNVSY